MKLVQLLAKELKEWPEGAKYACQDTAGKYEGSVFFVSNEPEHSDGSGGWSVCGVIDAIYNLEVSSDAKINTVTKSQWQAEREKMNKPKWIRHRGGLNPIDNDVLVEVKLRSGDIQSAYSSDFIWRHVGCDYSVNIMQYRIMQETENQEIEEVKDTNLGKLTYKLEIDATEATKEIDSLVAKWGQIESPLKWRDEIIELEAYEEEFRREREKLIRKLESEGFKLIDHMAPVYGEQIIDFSDWRNWQAGDIVECVTDCDNGQFTFAARYAVKSVNRSSVQIVEDDRGSNTNGWGASNFKFIRRP